MQIRLSKKQVELVGQLRLRRRTRLTVRYAVSRVFIDEN